MKNLCFVLISALAGSTYAQTSPSADPIELSLEEAIEIGLDQNFSTEKAALEVEKALSQKWEIISQGLPQINADVDYQNFLKQPVTLIPGEIAGGDPGTFVPVRFGTQQNLSGTATWSQLLFDGSYIVGVQSARTLLQISKNAKVKTDLEVRKAVINAYGNVLLAEEHVAILSKNLKNLQQNLSDTRKIYENGLAELEDVEQLTVTRLGLENSLSRSLRMLDISYQLHNMAMGLPVEKPVILTEDLDDLVLEFYQPGLLDQKISLEENIDVRIAAISAEAAAIFVKLEKAKALPTISGFLNYGINGYSDSFTFFKEQQKFYNQSILGINMRSPIFSSGMRNSRTNQKQLEYRQALVDLERVRNEVRLAVETARADYRFSLENLQTQQESLELAERIEQKNQIKFYEGLASSFELSEAQRQLYTAQQNVLQAMLEVIKSKVALETILSTETYHTNN